MAKFPQRVFSGIQPSGDIHIGNYLGAVKKWVELSNKYDCIYCIVDDHAITVEYDPKRMPRLTFEGALAAMACGLDPEQCTLFVQSHVPEHTELTWLFNTITPLGSMFRMTQFKEKSRNALSKALAAKGDVARSSLMYQLQNTGQEALQALRELEPELAQLDPEAEQEPAFIAQINDRLGNLMQSLQVGLGVSDASSGLFGYPVLQAADILLYKASLIPVGEDQEQHLELCREIAERFNKRFGKVFPMAKRLPGDAPRIMGLDGKQKMSKSLGNHIGVLDAPEVVGKKLARAFTDPQRIRRSDPGRPEMCNIYALHKYFTPTQRREELGAGCRTAGIGCFDCKKVLAEGIDATLAPIREKAQQLRAKPSMVHDALELGRQKASAIATETMEEVRSAMGIGPHAVRSLD